MEAVNDSRKRKTPEANEAGAGARSMAVNYQISQTVRWEGKLQELFIHAVAACGGPFVAKPTLVREAMGVPQLTLAQIKSHLQKHRIKMAAEHSSQQATAAQVRAAHRLLARAARRACPPTMPPHDGLGPASDITTTLSKLSDSGTLSDCAAGTSGGSQSSGTVILPPSADGASSASQQLQAAACTQLAAPQARDIPPGAQLVLLLPAGAGGNLLAAGASHAGLQLLTAAGLQMGTPILMQLGAQGSVGGATTMSTAQIVSLTLSAACGSAASTQAAMQLPAPSHAPSISAQLVSPPAMWAPQPQRLQHLQAEASGLVLNLQDSSFQESLLGPHPSAGLMVPCTTPSPRSSPALQSMGSGVSGEFAPFTPFASGGLQASARVQSSAWLPGLEGASTAPSQAPLLHHDVEVEQMTPLAAHPCMADFDLEGMLTMPVSHHHACPPSPAADLCWALPSAGALLSMLPPGGDLFSFDL